MSGSSDHEVSGVDSRIEVPVPELDDHRYQSPSFHAERPRRGTFDSLYGARQASADPNRPSIVVRDFEEAIDDEDGGPEGVPTPGRRVRRGTVDTVAEGRSPSPPNSVKAFAAARRRERGPSFSEPAVDVEDGLSRAMSVSSRLSVQSNHTAEKTPSIFTAKEAEEDVCFPHQDNYRKDQLYIDFDYLENFISAERDSHQLNREEVAAKSSCVDLRVDPIEKDNRTVATSNGDFYNLPSDDSVAREKDTEAADKAGPSKPQKNPIDPNRFSFFSSAWESTIHAAEMADLVLPGEDIRGLFELPRDEEGGVWWLNCNTTTKEEVQGICKAFGIHPLTIEDIVCQEAREKIELFPSYYFACFRSFSVVIEEDGDKEFVPFNVYVVVFREGVLSFSFAPNSHASHVRKRITALKDYVSLSSDWICYALIDNIVDEFGPVIRTIELEADGIEDEVFVMRDTDSSSFLRKIGQVRKNTMGLLRLLGGKADVLRGFTKRCNENYQVTPRMDIGMYLGDIQDHVVTMATNLGHFEKILSRAHSNYIAMLSVNSIEQGTATNAVLSKITFLASVLVPLNLVSGVFGMNVPVPYVNANPDDLAPFFSIIGFMAAMCAIILGVAKWAKWI